MKYFKLSRDDGVYWQVKKISPLLVNEGLWAIERKLRKCYYDNEWIEHEGHKYFLEKFNTKSLDGIEFGKFNAEKEIIKKSINDVDVFEIDEYDLEKEELIALLIKTKRQLQKRMDTQRIERKAWRLENRSTGIIQDTLSELLDRVKEFDNFGIVKRNTEFSNKEGLMMLNDWHIGEVVNLEDNKFNFEIARQRAEKYVTRAMEEFDVKNISEITMCFVGDMLNLDSHEDKKLTNEAARAVALEELFKITSMVIDTLLREGFELKLVGVVGNESRIKSMEFMSVVDGLAADNFDFILFMMLKARYYNCDYITFVNSCDRIEEIVKVRDKNIYLTHGQWLNHNKLEEEIASIKLRHFQKSKTMIDYCLFGHIHSALITDSYARGASLVGANGYSDKKLNIHSSCVSQNIGFVGDSIEIMSIKLN